MPVAEIQSPECIRVQESRALLGISHVSDYMMKSKVDINENLFSGVSPAQLHLRLLLFRARGESFSYAEGLFGSSNIFNLRHNAHFRDKRCQKRRQRGPKLAPLARRRSRDREPLFLGLYSQMPRNLLPFLRWREM
jgi:hypothetical protein